MSNKKMSNGRSTIKIFWSLHPYLIGIDLIFKSGKEINLKFKESMQKKFHGRNTKTLKA
jgi:hypothetical protein